MITHERKPTPRTEQEWEAWHGYPVLLKSSRGSGGQGAWTPGHTLIRVCRGRGTAIVRPARHGKDEEIPLPRMKLSWKQVVERDRHRHAKTPAGNHVVFHVIATPERGGYYGGHVGSAGPGVSLDEARVYSTQAVANTARHRAGKSDQWLIVTLEDARKAELRKLPPEPPQAAQAPASPQEGAKVPEPPTAAPAAPAAPQACANASCTHGDVDFDDYVRKRTAVAEAEALLAEARRDLARVEARLDIERRRRVP